MRGLKDFNFPAFHAAEADLRSRGLDVFSAASYEERKYGPGFNKSETGDLQDIPASVGFNFRTSFAADVEYICLDAQAIIVLPGWEKSSGARTEIAVGRVLSLPILSYPTLRPVDNVDIVRECIADVTAHSARVSDGETHGPTHQTRSTDEPPKFVAVPFMSTEEVRDILHAHESPAFNTVVERINARDAANRECATSPPTDEPCDPCCDVRNDTTTHVTHGEHVSHTHASVACDTRHDALNLSRRDTVTAIEDEARAKRLSISETIRLAMAETIRRLHTSDETLARERDADRAAATQWDEANKCVPCVPLCESPTSANVRTFETGATRDAANDKFDYEGFLSPLVLERFAEYMHAHRLQSDGTLRDADNWQKGIPREVYQSSFLRHVITSWKLWRGYTVKPERVGGKPHVPTIEDALCGVIFNAQGILHEILQDKAHCVQFGETTGAS
jgi:hypothetical protein